MIRILANQVLRGEDDHGSGEFGASRDGGKRLHEGVDITSTTGEVVFAPFSGKVTHLGTAYKDSDYLRSIHIKDNDSRFTVKLLYVDPSVKQGDEVIANTPIGRAQDLTRRYPNITNHVHLELLVNNIATDPTKWISGDLINREVVNESKVNSAKSTITYVGDSGISIEDYLNLEDTEIAPQAKKVFLDTSVNGITNREAIRQNQPFDVDISDLNAEYPIQAGTQLGISRNLIKTTTTYDSNITVTKITDPRYQPEFVKKLTNSKSFTIDKTTLENVNMQVWMWSRSRYSVGQSGWMNISNDIVRCSTESDMGSSDFSFEVTDKNTSWNKVWNRKTTSHSLDSINSTVGRAKFFYESSILQNDMVFIKFEKLSIEHTNDDVRDNWWDMIGLVDSVNSTHGAANASVVTTIRGRDLQKVMIDDHSYFNPYSIGHLNSHYGGDLGDRYDDGTFFSITPFLSRSIQETIEFIVQRISEVEYVPSDVFLDWNDPTQFKTTSATFNFDTAEESIGQQGSEKGIWSIIKVFIDDNVKDLRLIDDSITNPNGSIWELFSKIAQNPFVEYFGDTYGDQYYITFREPPFNYKSVSKSVLSIDGVVEDTNETIADIKRTGQVQLNPRTISIEEKDVITHNLSFDTTSYAWYSLEDRGNFAGSTVGLGISPNVHLNEYAQVFGNKRWSVTSNYSNYKFNDTENQERELDLYAEQQSQHLTFMVETSMYLPFSRRGSITINGDRRIKKGNWIYYSPTREVFYVTKVSHSASISNTVADRTTTLTVERGLVIDYIDKKAEFSYFKLVNLEKFEDGIYDIVTTGSADDKFDQKSAVSVDKDQFEFFVQRRQFA